MERSKYIGGSDAPKLLGLSDYGTALDVYKHKRLGVEPKDISNPHIDRGNEMEPFIEAMVRERYDPSANSPKNFEKWDREPHHGDQIMLAHPQMPYVGGHPDGVGDEILWEYKAPTTNGVDKLRRNGPHPYWVAQVQHYLFITKLPIGKIAILDYNNWGLLIFDVEPDPKLHELMEQRYRDLWRCVELGIPPSFDEIPPIKSLSKSEDEINSLLAEYDSAKDLRYRSYELEQELKGEIVQLAGGADRIQTDKWHAKITRVDKDNYHYYIVKTSRRDEYEVE